MKTIRVLGTIAILLFSASAATAYADVTFQVFYDDLAPYGQWVENPSYGYVWIPDEGPDFVPYSTGGYWIDTDVGWTWVSDYPWGWAPFHYGRWNHDPALGWYWVPGYEWGPAWVAWRSSPGYFGWVPLGPGVSLSLSFTWAARVPRTRWIFVRDQDFGRHDQYRYRVDPRRNAVIIGNSTVIRRTHVDRGRRSTYVSGPDRGYVQRVTGRRMTSVRLHDATQPGRSAAQSGRLDIYRPKVQPHQPGRATAPSRSMSADQYRNRQRQSPAGPGFRPPTAPAPQYRHGNRAPAPGPGAVPRSPQRRYEPGRGQPTAPSPVPVPQYRHGNRAPASGPGAAPGSPQHRYEPGRGQPTAPPSNMERPRSPQPTPPGGQHQEKRHGR